MHVLLCERKGLRFLHRDTRSVVSRSRLRQYTGLIPSALCQVYIFSAIHLCGQWKLVKTPKQWKFPLPLYLQVIPKTPLFQSSW